MHAEVFIRSLCQAATATAAADARTWLPQRKRRNMRNLIIGILTGLAGLMPLTGRCAAPPNIVIILTDDMGWSDLGCYGGEIRTPNLDALAAKGLRFTQFYNTARCCPTRASLLTGLYPHQANMGHMTYDGKQEGYGGDLGRDCLTIAEVLKLAGYSAYMSGKWHVTRFDGPEGPKDNWPRQRGFDRFYGTIKGGGSFFDPTTLCRDNTLITPLNDPEYRPARFYYTDAITDNAVRFIQEHRRARPAQPFFLYVAYTAAHWPMHALPEDIARQRGRYDAGYTPVRQTRFERQKQLGLVPSTWELSPQAGEWDKVENKEWEARCMEVYAAMVECMDRGVGRLVEALRQQGDLENTLILYLQDNGGCAENMGREDNPKWHLEGIKPMPPDELQPNIWPPMRTRDGRPVLGGPRTMPGGPESYIGYGQAWANVSNTPFREYKHWVHEGGISTPLIAHWPRGIPASRHNSLVTDPGHLVDLMATCVDLAGATYPAELQGRRIQPMEGISLRPAFAGQPLPRKQPIFFEHEGNRAVRDGRWKLVAKGPKGNWELYDMETDRTETRNLAEHQPERVKAMVAQWEAYAKRARVLPWIWKPGYGQPATTPSSNRKLRFDLKAGDELYDEEAPAVKGRSLTLEVRITEIADQGVLVSQGGSAHGYSLYVRDGRPALATRHKGKLSVVSAQAPLAKAPVTLSASLRADGLVTIKADDQVLAEGRVPGPLAEQPVDGLQVGRDIKGLVGDYPEPFAFAGKIGAVVVELK